MLLLLLLTLGRPIDWRPDHLAPDPRAAIVVFIGVDRTFDWRYPGRPEPYWPVGVRLWRAFDRRVIAVRGRDFDQLCQRAADVCTRRGIHRIARLEVWSHGGPGWFRIQRKRYYADTFAGEAAANSGAAWVRDHLSPGGLVAFRTCSTFHGRLGRQFANFASRFFNAAGDRSNIAVLGHTRPIAVIQPGRFTLAAGRRAAWPMEDGRTEQKLQGLEILARDIVWAATGGGYEVWRIMREGDAMRATPRAAARVANRRTK